MILNIILEVGKISFFNLLKVVPIPTILMGPKKKSLGPHQVKGVSVAFAIAVKTMDMHVPVAGCLLPAAVIAKQFILRWEPRPRAPEEGYQDITTMIRFVCLSPCNRWPGISEMRTANCELQTRSKLQCQEHGGTEARLH